MEKDDLKKKIKDKIDKSTKGISAGLKKAFSKTTTVTICKDCGFPIPLYPGRYPKKCPECGTDLEYNDKENEEQ